MGIQLIIFTWQLDDKETVHLHSKLDKQYIIIENENKLKYNVGL